MKKLSPVFFFLFTALSLYADDYRVSRAAYSVYAADLDLDGDVDIVNIQFNDSSGGFSENPVTGVAEESGLPASFSLHNYPNPFNSATVIQFSLRKAAEDLSVLIYNTKGQLVKTLFFGRHVPPGIHEVRWQGTDEHGRSAPSGVYCCVMKAGSRRKVRKMLLVR